MISKMFETFNRYENWLRGTFNRNFQPINVQISLNPQPSWIRSESVTLIDGETEVTTYEKMVDTYVRPLIARLALDIMADLGPDDAIRYAAPKLTTPNNVDSGSGPGSFQMIVDAAIPFRISVERGELWTGRYLYEGDSPKRVWDEATREHVHAKECKRGTRISVDAYVQTPLTVTEEDVDNLLEPVSA